MIENDYWQRLEFLVCQAFRAMPERRFHYLWCDGFIPIEYSINIDAPQIIGQVWICNGQQQSKWSFELLLPRSLNSIDEIDWAYLLPPENHWNGFY